jgi:hypothetical protein
MKIAVTPHAGSRPDRGGDPLDGLVNLFDLGVVLSVAFLLAALSSLNLDQLLTKRDALRRAAQQEIRAKTGERARTLGPTGGKVVGRGRQVGTVYRLEDGRLVYVEGNP